jgi:type IV pilus assembly protein PilM
MFSALTNFIKNTEIIGLDIGTHSIKIVEIDHASTGPILNTYTTIPHSTKLDGYWDSTTLRSLSHAIDTAMQKSKFVGIKTVMSIRSKDVFVTSMDFDKELSNTAIQAEINKQAPFFLPLPPEEMRLSFDMVKQPTISGKRRVVINATPDYIIENYRNLLEHINLDGEAIENCTLAHLRACNIVGDAILVDLGAHHSVFNAIAQGSLRASTYIEQGSSSISKEISHLLGVSEEVGERVMKDLNLVNLNHLPKPALDYCEIIQQELTHFLKQVEQLGIQNPSIYYTGGGSKTPGLQEVLAKTGMQAEYANPFANITIPHNILPFLSPYKHQYSVAIGLALKKEVL